MKTSLRFSNSYLRENFRSEPQHKELVALKHETFNNPEELILRSQQLLNEITKEYTDDQEFPKFEDYSFVYLYEKFDVLYQQEQALLKSLFEAQTSKQDSEKEAQSKKRITDLFKCELQIHKIVFFSNEDNVPALISLLEVLYDDYKNLDILLLLLYKKMWGQTEEQAESLNKLIHFMIPFAKVFGQEDFDILNIWNNRTESHEIPELIKVLNKQIEASLQSDTQLNEKDIFAFTEELSVNQANNEERRRLIKTISVRKEDFKQENLYYKMLGNLSLLQYLSYACEKDESEAVSFLRIGILANLFNTRLLNLKSSKNDEFLMDSLGALNEINLASHLEFSSQMLHHILSKLEQQGPEDQYINLLELQTDGIERTFGNRDLVPALKQGNIDIEKYYELFFKEELYGSKVQECLWSRIYRFFTINSSTLISHESRYINSSVYEVLVALWASPISSLFYQSFIKQEDADEATVNLKYFTLVSSSLQKILKLVTNEKFCDVLQKPMKKELIKAGTRGLHQDKKLFEKLEFIKIFDEIDNEAVAYLTQLENYGDEVKEITDINLSIQKKSTMQDIFSIMSKWNEAHIDYFGVTSEVGRLLEHVLESSKLINYLLTTYPKKKTWISHIKDKSALRTFVGIMSFWFNVLRHQTSQLEDEKNETAFKLIFHDIMRIDPSYLDKDQHNDLYLDVEDMFNQGRLMEKWKDWKIMICFMEFLWLKPSVEFNESDYGFGRVYRYFVNESKDARIVLKLAMRFVTKLEEKYKNLSTDYLKNLNQLKEQVEKDQKEEEEKAKKEKEKEEAKKEEENLGTVSETNNENLPKPEATSEHNNSKPSEEAKISEANKEEVTEVKEEEKKDFEVEKIKEEESKQIEGASDEKKKEEVINFNFDKDGKLPKEKPLLEELKFLAVNCCNRLQLISYRMAASSKGNFDDVKEETQAIIRRVARMIFSPLLVFADYKDWLKRIEYYTRELCYYRSEHIGPIFEGFCDGIIELCEAFNLIEDATFEKINHQSLYKLLLRIKNYGFVGAEALPHDFTWTEASLLSLLIAVKHFGFAFKEHYDSCFYASSDFTSKFQKASTVFLKLTSSLYKAIYKHLDHENSDKSIGEWKDYSKHCQKVIEAMHEIVEGFSRFLTSVHRDSQYVPAVKEIYLNSLNRLVLSNEMPESEEINSKVKIAQNLSIIKEFITFIPTEQRKKREIIGDLMIDASTIQRLLSFEKYILEEYFKYPHRDSENIISEAITVLGTLLSEEPFQGESVWTHYRYGKLEILEKQTKETFPEITKFVTDLNMERIIKQKYGVLTENMDHIFKFFEELYKLYGKCTKEKANTLDKKIETVEKTFKRSHKDKQKKESKKEEPVDLGDIGMGGLFGEEEEDDNIFGLFGEEEENLKEEKKVEVVEQTEELKPPNIVEGLAGIDSEPQKIEEIVKEEVQESKNEQEGKEIREPDIVVPDETDKKEEQNLESLQGGSEKPHEAVEETKEIENQAHSQEENKTNAEDNIKKPATEQQAFEDDDFFGFGLFDLMPTEEEKQKEREKEKEKEEKARKDADEKTAVHKKEKEELLAEYKKEIENYLKACLPNAIYFTTVKDLAPLGEQFKSIPTEFWINEYEKIYKKTLLFVHDILNSESDTFLKKEIAKELESFQEISDGGMKLDRTESTTLNRIMTLDFFFQQIKQFFVDKIGNKLKMSKAFIESLVVIVSSLWREMLNMDLTPFRKEIKEFSLFGNISNIIINIGKIVIDYIIAHTANKFSVINASTTATQGTFQNLLLGALDMTELSISVHNRMIQDFKHSILEEFEECHETLVNLINATLRSNKALRVPFLNGGLLAKLLDVKKFELSNQEQIEPFMSLFAILLEDSLILENQVELALKKEIKENGTDKISLENISNQSAFKLFRNYKKLINVLEAYQVSHDDQIKVAQLESGDLFVKDITGKYNMLDFKQNQKPHQKVDMIKYLQDTISPVSLKTLHVLLRALIVNFCSEGESFALYVKKMQKQKEKDDRKKLKKQQKAQIQSMSSIASEDDDDEDEEGSDLDRELALYDKNVPFKDVTALVLLLSCILDTYSHLVPHIILQEADMEDLSKRIEKSNPVWILFSDKQKRYSLFDVILKLLLWRDGESALFIVGALLKQDHIVVELEETQEIQTSAEETDVKNNKKEIPLKYLLFSKIFQIMEDALDSESASGRGLKTFESMLMRQNIAKIVSYISHNFLKDLNQQEDQVQRSIMNIVQKLLLNIDMLASFMEWTELERPLLDILSGIVIKNMEENLDQTKVKECYAGILRTIEEGHEKNTTEVSSTLQNKFEELIFTLKNNLAEEEVNQEEQNLYEMWNEKEQWEKEETRKLMAVSNLKNDTDLVIQLNCPINDSTNILTDKNFGSLYRENKKEVESLMSFYGMFERKEIKDFKIRKEYYDYYQYWRDTNRSLHSLSTSYAQSFGCTQDYQNKPLILRYIGDKSQDLGKDMKIISDYIQQYKVDKGGNAEQDSQAIVNQEISKSQEEEKKTDVVEPSNEQKQEEIPPSEGVEKEDIESNTAVNNIKILEEKIQDIIDAVADKLSENKIEDQEDKEKNEEVQITKPEESAVEAEKVKQNEEIKEEEGKEENKEGEDKADEKDDVSVDENGIMIIRYFPTHNVEKERHLKYQVNKALKQGRRVKEIISVEKTLRVITGKGLDDLNIDEMIKELTKNMREFDRNVIYASLGKEIKSRLSDNFKKEIQKIEKEFAKMKEDFSAYNNGLKELSKKKQEEAETQAKNNEEKKENDIENKEEAKQEDIPKQEDTREISTVEENGEPKTEEKKEEAQGDQATESKEQPENEENKTKAEGETEKETKQEALESDQVQEKETITQEVKREETANNEAQPEEAKEEESAPNAEEEKENQEQKEEINGGASDYDEMEDDHKFFTDANDDEEGDKAKDEQASEQESGVASLNHIEEEKKDERENAEEQKDQNADPETVEERNSPNSKAKQARRKEVTDDTKKLINSFRFDDAFLLRICTLFFAKYTTASEPLEVITRFFKDAISRNPVNDIKILDALVFILYSPELLESAEVEDFPPKKYIFSQEKTTPQTLFKTIAENMVHYLTTTMKDKERSYVFFTPAKYLNKFGIKLLEPLKEKTGYSKKISQHYSVLDMIIGLLESPLILESQKCAQKIVDSVKELLKVEKKIVLGEGSPEKITLESYKKHFSYMNIYSLLNILSSSQAKSSDLQNKLEELFNSFKDLPDLFINLQEHLNTYTLALIPSANKVLEDNIRTLKESNPESITKEGLDKIIESLNLSQFQISKVILSSFVNIFYHYLFTGAKKNIKTSKKVYGLLQNVIQDLLISGSIQTFMLNIYEVADLIHRVKETLKISDSQVEIPLIALAELCLCHYSLIIMQTSCDPIQEKEEIKKENGSISDIEPMPKLARLISYEDAEPSSIEITSLKRTFSHYKRQSDIDFKTIFANFGLKYSKAISHISQTISQKKDNVLTYALTILLPKCPWILDLETKREIMIQKIRNHQKSSGMHYHDDRRSITINRKALAYSTLSELKNLNKRDILLNFDVSYKDERGIDAGGLRREFFSLMSKELFDPNVGLFGMSDNKLSIQPSLFSGIVPHHLKFLELAGLILAKAIEDEIVVDLSFTKSFLKHILGKEITISDLEGVDADLGRNLQWILQNDVEELYLTFTHEVEILGERVTLELKEGGFDTFVNEENKKEYVKTVCETRMTKEIEKQLKSFLKGFHLILPKECLSHLSSGELELIIAGTPHLDFEEMKKYACVSGHSSNSIHVKWLWEVLQEFSQEDLAAFLYFVSGSPKVSYGGFKDNPINISKCSHKGGLPIAHTCSYEIELPEYESKDKLREKLLMAIFDGVEGFFIS